MNKWIKKISILLIQSGLGLFSYLIPIKKNLIIFSMPKNRYADNQRALFEYISVNHSELNVIWLYDDEKPKLKEPHLISSCVFIKKYTLHGYLASARSNLLMLSHGFGDYGVYYRVVRRKSTVVLWHAVTTKCCGLLDKKNNQKQKRDYKNKETKFYNAVIASSQVDAYYTSAYTGVSIDKVHVTGLPRHDKIKAEERAVSSPLKVLYAPTFRDYEVSKGSLFFPFTDFSLENLVQFLEKNNIIFILRPHPSDKKSISHIKQLIESCPSVFEDGAAKKYDDNTDLINSSDAVITDYSSIYIDLLVADKPCAFIPFDLEKYLDKRGMAYNYELISPGPIISSYKDFEAACFSLLKNSPEWLDRREQAKKIFLTYTDGLACYRVTNLAKNLMRLDD